MNSWPCQQPLVVAHTPTNPFLGLHSRSPPRVSLVVVHNSVEGKRTSGGCPYIPRPSYPFLSDDFAFSDFVSSNVQQPPAHSWPLWFIQLKTVPQPWW